MNYNNIEENLLFYIYCILINKFEIKEKNVITFLSGSLDVLITKLITILCTVHSSVVGGWCTPCTRNTRPHGERCTGNLALYSTFVRVIHVVYNHLLIRI